MTDPSRVEQIIREASSLHTRHTLSDGYAIACDWLSEKFVALGLEPRKVRTHLPAGPRIPEAMEVDQVVAEVAGELDELVIVGAHLDSLNLGSDPRTARAPGANDNASGLAVMLECAWLLAREGPPRATVRFVGFAAEEQGLIGATNMATEEAVKGTKIRAVLTSDMVGSPTDGLGAFDSSCVRLFSQEGISRELARFVEWTARTEGLDGFVKMVLRHDRFGRGGDHTPFALAGFPAVRFTELKENYTVQHSDRDLLEAVDCSYVAKTALVNWLALRSIVVAEAAPTQVWIKRDQSHSTTLEWEGEAKAWDVFVRDTRSCVWEERFVVEGERSVVIEGFNKDDHEFAVAACGGVPVAAE